MPSLLDSLASTTLGGTSSGPSGATPQPPSPPKAKASPLPPVGPNNIIPAIKGLTKPQLVTIRRVFEAYTAHLGGSHLSPTLNGIVPTEDESLQPTGANQSGNGNASAAAGGPQQLLSGQRIRFSNFVNGKDPNAEIAMLRAALESSASEEATTYMLRLFDVDAEVNSSSYGMPLQLFVNLITNVVLGKKVANAAEARLFGNALAIRRARVAALHQQFSQIGGGGGAAAASSSSSAPATAAAAAAIVQLGPTNRVNPADFGLCESSYDDADPAASIPTLTRAEQQVINRWAFSIATLSSDVLRHKIARTKARLVTQSQRRAELQNYATAAARRSVSGKEEGEETGGSNPTNPPPPLPNENGVSSIATKVVEGVESAPSREVLASFRIDRKKKRQAQQAAASQARRGRQAGKEGETADHAPTAVATTTTDEQQKEEADAKDKLASDISGGSDDDEDDKATDAPHTSGDSSSDDDETKSEEEIAGLNNSPRGPRSKDCSGGEGEKKQAPHPTTSAHARRAPSGTTSTMATPRKGTITYANAGVNSTHAALVSMALQTQLQRWATENEAHVQRAQHLLLQLTRRVPSLDDPDAPLTDELSEIQQSALGTAASSNNGGRSAYASSHSLRGSGRNLSSNNNSSAAPSLGAEASHAAFSGVSPPTSPRRQRGLLGGAAATSGGGVFDLTSTGDQNNKKALAPEAPPPHSQPPLDDLTCRDASNISLALSTFEGPSWRAIADNYCVPWSAFVTFLIDSDAREELKAAGERVMYVRSNLPYAPFDASRRAVARYRHAQENASSSVPAGAAIDAATKTATSGGSGPSAATAPEERALPNTVPLEYEHLHHRSASACATNRSGTTIVTGGEDGLVKLWCASTGAFGDNILNAGFAWVIGLDFLSSSSMSHFGGDLLAAVTSNGHITIINTTNDRRPIVQKYVGASSVETAISNVPVLSTLTIRKYGLRPGESGARAPQSLNGKGSNGKGKGAADLTREQYIAQRREAQRRLVETEGAAARGGGSDSDVASPPSQSTATTPRAPTTPTSPASASAGDAGGDTGGESVANRFRGAYGSIAVRPIIGLSNVSTFACFPEARGLCVFGTSDGTIGTIDLYADVTGNTMNPQSATSRWGGGGAASTTSTSAASASASALQSVRGASPPPAHSGALSATAGGSATAVPAAMRATIRRADALVPLHLKANAHSDVITGLAYAPRYSTVVSVGLDGRIGLLRLGTGTFQTLGQAAPSAGLGLGSMGSGASPSASLSFGASASHYNAKRSASTVGTGAGNGYAQQSLTFSPTATAASIGHDATIGTIIPAAPSLLGGNFGGTSAPNKPLLGVCWCEPLQLFTTFSSDRRVRLWNLLKADPVHVISPPLPCRAILSAAVTPLCHLIVLTIGNGRDDEDGGGGGPVGAGGVPAASSAYRLRQRQQRAGAPQEERSLAIIDLKSNRLVSLISLSVEGVSNEGVLPNDTDFIGLFKAATTARVTGGDAGGGGGGGGGSSVVAAAGGGGGPQQQQTAAAASGAAEISRAILYDSSRTGGGVVRYCPQTGAVIVGLKAPIEFRARWSADASAEPLGASQHDGDAKNPSEPASPEHPPIATVTAASPSQSPMRGTVGGVVSSSSVHVGSPLLLQPSGAGASSASPFSPLLLGEGATSGEGSTADRDAAAAAQSQSKFVTVPTLHSATSNIVAYPRLPPILEAVPAEGGEGSQDHLEISDNGSGSGNGGVGVGGSTVADVNALLMSTNTNNNIAASLTKRRATLEGSTETAVGGATDLISVDEAAEAKGAPSTRRRLFTPQELEAIYASAATPADFAFSGPFLGAGRNAINTVAESKKKKPAVVGSGAVLSAARVAAAADSVPSAAIQLPGASDGGGAAGLIASSSSNAFLAPSTSSAATFGRDKSNQQQQHRTVYNAQKIMKKKRGGPVRGLVGGRAPHITLLFNRHNKMLYAVDGRGLHGFDARTGELLVAGAADASVPKLAHTFRAVAEVMSLKSVRVPTVDAKGQTLSARGDVVVASASSPTPASHGGAQPTSAAVVGSPQQQTTAATSVSLPPIGGASSSVGGRSIVKAGSAVAGTFLDARTGRRRRDTEGGGDDPSDPFGGGSGSDPSSSSASQPAAIAIASAAGAVWSSARQCTLLYTATRKGELVGWCPVTCAAKAFFPLPVEVLGAAAGLSRGAPAAEKEVSCIAQRGYAVAASIRNRIFILRLDPTTGIPLALASVGAAGAGGRSGSIAGTSAAPTTAAPLPSADLLKGNTAQLIEATKKMRAAVTVRNSAMGGVVVGGGTSSSSSGVAGAAPQPHSPTAPGSGAAHHHHYAGPTAPSAEDAVRVITVPSATDATITSLKFVRDDLIVCGMNDGGAVLVGLGGALPMGGIGGGGGHSSSRRHTQKEEGTDGSPPSAPHSPLLPAVVKTPKPAPLPTGAEALLLADAAVCSFINTKTGAVTAHATRGSHRPQQQQPSGNSGAVATQTTPTTPTLPPPMPSPADAVEFVEVLNSRQQQAVLLVLGSGKIAVYSARHLAIIYKFSVFPEEWLARRTRRWQRHARRLAVLASTSAFVLGASSSSSSSSEEEEDSISSGDEGEDGAIYGYGAGAEEAAAKRRQHRKEKRRAAAAAAADDDEAADEEGGVLITAIAVTAAEDRLLIGDRFGRVIVVAVPAIARPSSGWAAETRVVAQLQVALYGCAITSIQICREVPMPGGAEGFAELFLAVAASDDTVTLVALNTANTTTTVASSDGSLSQLMAHPTATVISSPSYYGHNASSLAPTASPLLFTSPRERQQQQNGATNNGALHSPLPLVMSPPASRLGSPPPTSLFTGIASTATNNGRNAAVIVARRVGNFSAFRRSAESRWASADDGTWSRQPLLPPLDLTPSGPSSSSKKSGKGGSKGPLAFGGRAATKGNNNSGQQQRIADGFSPSGSPALSTLNGGGAAFAAALHSESRRASLQSLGLATPAAAALSGGVADSKTIADALSLDGPPATQKKNDSASAGESIVVNRDDGLVSDGGAAVILPPTTRRAMEEDEQSLELMPQRSDGAKKKGHINASSALFGGKAPTAGARRAQCEALVRGDTDSQSNKKKQHRDPSPPSPRRPSPPHGASSTQPQQPQPIVVLPPSLRMGEATMARHVGRRLMREPAALGAYGDDGGTSMTLTAAATARLFDGGALSAAFEPNTNPLIRHPPTAADAAHVGGMGLGTPSGSSSPPPPSSANGLFFAASASSESYHRGRGGAPSSPSAAAFAAAISLSSAAHRHRHSSATQSSRDSNANPSPDSPRPNSIIGAGAGSPTAEGFSAEGTVNRPPIPRPPTTPTTLSSQQHQMPLEANGGPRPRSGRRTATPPPPPSDTSFSPNATVTEAAATATAVESSSASRGGGGLGSTMATSWNQMTHYLSELPVVDGGDVPDAAADAVKESPPLPPRRPSTPPAMTGGQGIGGGTEGSHSARPRLGVGIGGLDASSEASQMVRQQYRSARATMMERAAAATSITTAPNSPRGAVPEGSLTASTSYTATHGRRSGQQTTSAVKPITAASSSSNAGAEDPLSPAALLTSEAARLTQYNASLADPRRLVIDGARSAAAFSRAHFSRQTALRGQQQPAGGGGGDEDEDDFASLSPTRSTKGRRGGGAASLANTRSSREDTFAAVEAKANEIIATEMCPTSPANENAPPPFVPSLQREVSEALRLRGGAAGSRSARRLTHGGGGASLSVSSSVVGGALAKLAESQDPTAARVPKPPRAMEYMRRVRAAEEAERRQFESYQRGGDPRLHSK